MNKLIIREIEALLYNVHNVALKGSSSRKPNYVSALNKEMGNNISKFEPFLSSATNSDMNSAAEDEVHTEQCRD